MISDISHIGIESHMSQAVQMQQAAQGVAEGHQGKNIVKRHLNQFNLVSMKYNSLGFGFIQKPQHTVTF